MPRSIRTMFFLLLVLCGVARAADQPAAAILFTADTLGHVHACQSCPGSSGLGGLDRRATLVASLRKDHPGSVLIDAGGALFGPESAESGGEVIASAYSAMGYDLLNLGAGDFRLQKAHTLELIHKAKLKAISANLLDDGSGQPIAEPFVVLPVGGRKIAFIGLTEPPAGLQFLPSLKHQLEGIRFRTATEALAEWLPRAKAQADGVVVVYSGSPTGLHAIQKSAGDGVLAILGVGSVSNESNGSPVIGTAQAHGRSIGVVTLVDKSANATEVPVDPSLAVDAAMTKLLDTYAPASPVLPSAMSPVPAATLPTTAPSLLADATPTSQPVAAAPVSSVAEPPRPAIAVPAPAPPVPPSVVVASPRVPAHQSLQPRGLAGVGLTADQVNASIDRGRDFLWATLRDRQKKHPGTPIITDGPELLAALALVHADAVQKIPEFDRQLRDYLNQSDPRKMTLGLYESAIYCMLIEAYGDPTFLPKLRDTARYLVELQGPAGTWNYGRTFPDKAIFGPRQMGNRSLAVMGGNPLDGGRAAEEILARSTAAAKDTDGDNSTTQFALLALQSAARWHLKSSPPVWQNSLAVLRSRQCPDGSWDYHEKSSGGYGSMTCAAICAMTIDRFELGEKQPAADEQIERGIGWLDRHFSVHENPSSGNYLYYYLYSLERVGRILDTEFIGSHEWYPLGARFLVDVQKPAGKWIEKAEDEDPRLATSFALLFLTRATATLDPALARNGSGELRTSLTTAPPARLYIILDASGSMLDDMDGRLKFDIARDAVSAMLALLPADAQVALRVYGHRLGSLQPGSDEDTELKIPMAKYDRDKYATVLKSLRPHGKTPLALSLEKMIADQGSSPDPTTVVLLTDGGEDTMPRRDPVKAAAELAKIPNLTFHIIGFDVNQQDWNDQLHAMAVAGKGKYWSAPKSADLQRSVRAAILGDPDYFRINDSTGREVFRGHFGQTTRLAEGKYNLITPYAGREFHEGFWINTNASTVVTFDASAATSDPTAAAVDDHAMPPATGATAKIRYCTHCGKPLATGAKFCTSCGTKVESGGP